MSHLPDRRDMYRRVAAQADKILNPGHIPVDLLDHFIRADEDRPRDRDPQWANGPSTRCDVLLLISHIILTHSNDTYAPLSRPRRRLSGDLKYSSFRGSGPRVGLLARQRTGSA